MLLSMNMTAFAYTRIDVDKETSLTLEYVSGSTPLSGADFRLYKVADIDATNRYTVAKDFEEYPVTLEGLDSEGWLNLAATLAGYAARDNPDNPGSPNNPDNPGGSDKPIIPQTGQLWWPVPLLAGCGLALFVVGWGLVFLKREKDA